MNYSTKRNGNKKNNILFMVFVLFLLSNSSVFAQATTENNSDQIASTENNSVEKSNIEMRSIKPQETSTDSNMNFILWFMGSKQSPNSSVLPVGTSSKKQFMTSGSEPNRLLLKAFLKKAVNFESSMV